jgi:limonene-1,2-epoxide hydrolase
VTIECRSSSEEAHLAVAEKLTSLFAMKVASEVAQIYADDAEIWHNFDNVTQTKAENMALLTIVFQAFSDLKFANIKRFATDFGFVQQHDMTGTHVGGGRFSAPVCMIACVKGNQITRMEEYLDATPLFTLMRA